MASTDLWPPTAFEEDGKADNDAEEAGGEGGGKEAERDSSDEGGEGGESGGKEDLIVLPLALCPHLLGSHASHTSHPFSALTFLWCIISLAPSSFSRIFWPPFLASRVFWSLCPF